MSLFDTSTPGLGTYSGKTTTTTGSSGSEYSGKSSVTDYISTGGTALAGIIAAWKGQPQNVTYVSGIPNNGMTAGANSSIIWILVLAVVLVIMFFAFKKK